MKKPSMLTATFLVAAITILAQNDWRYFGQDQGATRYSTLAQINVVNVKNLKRAWIFHTGDKSGFFESTPLVVDSVMYFAAANGFYAVDAVTGQQIWKYEATETTRRGVAYWPGDGRSVSRIIASTGSKLVALDAKTGKPIPDFGDNGFAEMGTTMSSAAAIYKDFLLTQATKPVINAWNARTGKLVWTFNLIAQPDDPANKTWEGNSWENPGGTNVWGFLSVDAERGLLFVPVSMPGGNDYYGGQHHGDNLYGDCLVAIDINTGKLKWYQQLVHHDIWDYDLGAAPTLLNIVRNGRTIPAVAQITKMGLMFIFDRTNGTPIFGMEERPVPQTEAPGEKTSPTQPFPLKPAPLAKNSITKDDLQTGISPEHDAYCQQLWDKYHLANDGPYTPWDVNRDVVVFPGAIGGGNWNGVTFNPKLGLMFTNVMNAGQWGHLAPAAPVEDAGGAGIAERQAAHRLKRPTLRREDRVRTTARSRRKAGVSGIPKQCTRATNHLGENWSQSTQIPATSPGECLLVRSRNWKRRVSKRGPQVLEAPSPLQAISFSSAPRLMGNSARLMLATARSCGVQNWMRRLTPFHPPTWVVMVNNTSPSPQEAEVFCRVRRPIH